MLVQPVAGSDRRMPPREVVEVAVDESREGRRRRDGWLLGRQWEGGDRDQDERAGEPR